MKPDRIFLVAGLPVLLIFVSPCLAGTLPEAAKAALEKRFEEMDTNGDGRIDRDEYMEYETRKANERFDVADQNDDGFITRREAERATEKRQEEMREKMREWREKQVLD